MPHTMFFTPVTLADNTEGDKILKSIQNVITNCMAWVLPSNTALVKSPIGSPQNADTAATTPVATASPGCALVPSSAHQALWKNSPTRPVHSAKSLAMVPSSVRNS
ncbi:MAG: hypothetical protein D8B53_05565 [Corynebacterium sp.]|nr:MAG: hypothetical protein D8B53_05565 [Corynebacterium sp.]